VIDVADFVIEAEPRTVVGKKVKRLRSQGVVPITVYGPKMEPVNLQVAYRPLEVALMKAGGTNLIDLKAAGKTHTVLAREVQRDVLKGTIMHVDFFVVDQSAAIRADIPIHLVGESPVVAARKGILLTGTNTITIETLPSKLMNFIEIDLTALKEIGDSVIVADLDLGDDVKIINEPEEMIARVAQSSAARAAEAEEAEEAAASMSEPEVIAKGKADEDEE